MTKYPQPIAKRVAVLTQESLGKEKVSERISGMRKLFVGMAEFANEKNGPHEFGRLIAFYDGMNDLLNVFEDGAVMGAHEEAAKEAEDAKEASTAPPVATDD